MAFLSYGAARGLAYRHNYQQDIYNLRQNEMLDRQAQHDAETKAMLLGDMLQTASANNAYDNAQIKEFSHKRISEIGNFINENPDYMSNPMKWAHFKELQGSLLDNQFVKDGVANDREYGMMMDWIAKNPGSEHDPEIQSQLARWNSYQKTGMIDGEKKRFMFFDPTANYDLSQYLMGVAGNVTMTGMKDMGTYRKLFASDSDKNAAANFAIQNNKHVMYQFNAMSDEQKKQFTPTEMDMKMGITTPQQKYVRSLMEPWFKTQISEKHITVTGGGKGKGSGSGGGGERSLFAETFRYISDPRNKTGSANVPPQHIESMLLDKNGFANMSSALVWNTQNPTDQDFTPINLGQQKFSPNGVVRMIKDPSGKPITMVADGEIKMPVTQFIKQFGDEGWQAVNFGGFLGGATTYLGNYSDDSSFDIRDEYSGKFRKGTDDKGNPVVVIKTSVPVDPNSVNAHNFDNASGGVKQEEMSSDINPKDEDPTLYTDGKGNYFMDAEGKIPYKP